MNDLVQIYHDEAMTTSLAIAEGTQVEHKNVLELIRRYMVELSEFGGVAFQTRPFETSGGVQSMEVAWLNEQQATFLVTLMRNSPIVVQFKKALVKAFFAMRDQLQYVETMPSMPTSVGHRADHVVAATRCFNGLMRLSSTLKLGHARAAAAANQAALRHTGVDVLDELGISPEELQQTEIKPPRPTDDMSERIADWLAEEAQAVREEFALREFLIGALGIPPTHRDWRRFETAAGIVIRRLGFSKIERRNGPHRYLYRRPTTV